MEDYIRKVRMKAMQYNGLVEEFLTLQSTEGHEAKALSDGSIEITKTDSESAPKLLKKGNWAVSFKGDLHVIEHEQFMDEFYKERNTSSKKEEKKEEKKTAPKKTKLPEKKVEAEKVEDTEANTNEKEF